MATSTNPEWDPILMACQKNDIETVQKMLTSDSYKGIVHHANAIGQTALHIAAWWANVDIMRLLLENDANIHAQNTLTGATPLHCAMQSSQAAWRKSKRLASMELLLSKGADPNMQDFLGRIPLEYVDDDDIDRKEIEQLLKRTSKHAIYECIDKGDLQGLLTELATTSSNDNAQERIPKFQDATPLTYLIQKWTDDNDESETPSRPDETFYPQALDAILQQPKDNDNNNNNDLSSNKADDTKAMDCLLLAILEKYKRKENADIQTTQWQEAATRLLIVNVKPATSVQETIWMTAARRNYLDLARWLLVSLKLPPWYDPQQQQQQEKSGDNNNTDNDDSISIQLIQNRQGMTPLQFAARSGHLEMVDLLLSQQQQQQRDDTHNTTTSFLLHHQDHQGQTALDAARVNGHDAIVERLVQLQQP